MKINSIIHGDCLEVMKNIPDASIDMILCDLPYGTTQCKWDTIIPFDRLWLAYERIIKDNGSIILTASQPFTSALIMSNTKLFKYEWIWQKNRGSNFALLKYQPFKEHESILVFSKKTHLYNPIMQDRAETGKSRVKYSFKNAGGGDATGFKIVDDGSRRNATSKRMPSSIQKFNTEVGLHPTQKPVALFEYLIKTYTNEGMTVLDNCAGSGTTAIACINTNRKYICIEKDENYFNSMSERISKHL